MAEDSEDDGTPEFSVKDSDHLLVKAVLRQVSFNVHAFLTNMQKNEGQKFLKLNEKIQAEKNSDRIIDMLKKSMDELVALEAVCGMFFPDGVGNFFSRVGWDLFFPRGLGTCFPDWVGTFFSRWGWELFFPMGLGTFCFEVFGFFPAGSGHRFFYGVSFIFMGLIPMP